MDKTVKIYIDLMPGWHDCHEPLVCPMAHRPFGNLTTGYRRYSIEVSLPCFGGSADTERTIYPPRSALRLEEDRSESPNDEAERTAIAETARQPEV